MAEAEWWLSETDPNAALEFLKGKASPRKLKLFAVACLRRTWSLVPDPAFHRLIEVAEAEADGLASNRQIGTAIRYTKGNFTDQLSGGHALAALRELRDWLEKRDRRLWGHVKALSIAHRAADAVAYHALHTSGYERGETAAAETPVWLASNAAERKAQRDLFHCIFADPLGPVAVESAWLVHNDGIAPRLSQATYDERAFERLPILADALEEAGCADEQVLSHLRGPGPHVRGCWVVDLLLGKK
jgi:hypothetical protein